jgi:hypothetical protein
LDSVEKVEGEDGLYAFLINRKITNSGFSLTREGVTEVPEATKRKLVSLYSFEFLIVAELMGSCHAESPKGSKLTLLLNSVNCVCQPVLLSVALWLDSHRLLLL